MKELLTVSRINRNIVECKAEKTESSPFQPGVLIETLWNVKQAPDGIVSNRFEY